MKRMLRVLQVGVSVTAIALAPLAHPAVAAPTHVNEDATDNHFSFSYDADTGTVSSQSSFRRAAQSGVRFEVAVSEAEGYGSGLVGRLRLRLEDDRAYIYDGWFVLEIANDSGDIVYTRARPATVHLKPRPGQRRTSLSFRFDLPTGTYNASGAFEAG